MNWWERYNHIKVGDYVKFTSVEGIFPWDRSNDVLKIGNIYKVKSCNEEYADILNRLIPFNSLVLENGISIHWGTFELVEKPKKIIKPFKIVEWCKKYYV